MKTFAQILMLLAIVVLFACRDTSKEDAEAKKAIQEIETIEKEVDSISESMEKEAKELEDAIKELDSI